MLTVIYDRLNLLLLRLETIKSYRSKNFVLVSTRDDQSWAENNVFEQCQKH